MLSSSAGRVAILALGVVAGSAHAQTSALERFSNMSSSAQLQSDELLKASLDEIGKLSPRGTEAFARTLADCSGDILNDINSRGVCGRSRTYFQIVAPSDGPIGILYNDVAFYSVYLLGVDHGRGRNTEDQTIAGRVKHIKAAWANALRSRFGLLDNERLR